MEIETKMDLSYKYSEKDKTLLVNLKISLLKDQLPFSFNIESEGIFSFQEALEKKIIDKIGNINCPAIMFPYSRELIADLTRRAGFPPLHLQPVNFVELANL